MNKIRDQFLPYSLPSLGKEEIQEVVETLQSGWLTMGPKTERFEKEFSQHLGVRFAVGLNSCTAALHLALLAHGIKEGDEVILPSFTFAATANVVVHAGAKPVFADIDPVSLNLDPQQVKRKLTPKTKAVLPVHYGGWPVALEEIQEIADQNGLVIIEDAAHALGSEYHGKKVGTFGNTTCFSFYATKNISTGEGGMLTTDDDRVADFAFKNRLHGISRDAWKRYTAEGSWYYQVEDAGWKYNMNDIQASLGIHQLQKLPLFLKKRNEYAKLYEENLKGIKQVKISSPFSDVRHAYQLYSVLLDEFSRDDFIKLLATRKIGTSVHFIPLHLQSYYRKNFGCAKGDLPVTENVFERIVSLPLYPSMTRDDVLYVIDSIREIFGR